MINYFLKHKFDAIFHLASLFIAEHDSNQIDDLLKSNIIFGTHILEAMKYGNVKNMVNIGTYWQHYKNEEYNPVCLYAASKEAFEKIIEFYIQVENIKVITLKLYDIYGINDKRKK
ncbi:NAD(P)-dependent oxidoreductase [Caloramator sp. mosi_1]|uniref:NAD-dependent epimerase/dehydratase family protein n=1 Tax=Caloramator sp. mosi_1 TaxID=3023090 RepID=UPI002360BEBB|nr:NAD(P)-dependent oxidoreductase [Caloramator sp. mosi_1]WDC83286.1 NAD(P)-dependent oxidoreductase [Caloramator sp. mosi_1]